MRYSRRTLLQGGVVGGVSLLAGCNGVITRADIQRKPVGGPSEDPLAAPQFYQTVRLANGGFADTYYPTLITDSCNGGSWTVSFDQTEFSLWSGRHAFHGRRRQRS